MAKKSEHKQHKQYCNKFNRLYKWSIPKKKKNLKKKILESLCSRNKVLADLQKENHVDGLAVFQKLMDELE